MTITLKEEVCPECGGKGWISGSRAAHGCDGTEESCSINCPVQEQTQEGCQFCGGFGVVKDVTSSIVG